MDESSDSPEAPRPGVLSDLYPGRMNPDVNNEHLGHHPAKLDDLTSLTKAINTPSLLLAFTGQLQVQAKPATQPVEDECERGQLHAPVQHAHGDADM